MNSSVPKNIILIGASTGGPGEIQKIVEALPKLHNTSLIIAQHMVDGFLDSFAKRLQSSSQDYIGIAEDQEHLKSGHIYVCEGQTYITKGQNSIIFTKTDVEKNSYNPNINMLFNSFVPLVKELNVLCVILTGIGDDGVQACKNLSTHGARCITQDSISAIVDGMPSRARQLVVKVEVENTLGIIKEIKEFTHSV